jgi:hypothetical protein
MLSAEEIEQAGLNLVPEGVTPETEGNHRHGFGTPQTSVNPVAPVLLTRSSFSVFFEHC